MASTTHKCASCKQEVDNASACRFTNLYYHPECYRCALCSKELEKEHPLNHKHSPVCHACYDNLRYPATSESNYFHPTTNS